MQSQKARLGAFVCDGLKGTNGALPRPVPSDRKRRRKRAVSSVGRASRLHREGRQFEPVTAHHFRDPAGYARCRSAHLPTQLEYCRIAFSGVGVRCDGRRENRSGKTNFQAPPQGEARPGNRALFRRKQRGGRCFSSLAICLSLLRHPALDTSPPVAYEPRTLMRALGARGGVAQLVRALACHARGRGFESRHSRHPRRITARMDAFCGNAIFAKESQIELCKTALNFPVFLGFFPVDVLQ